MQMGKIVGNMVCSAKYETLTGIKLLVVQLYKDLKPDKLAVAADALGVAGINDFVYLIGSKEAAAAFRKKNVPVDLAVMGVVDQYNGEAIKN